MALEVVSPPNFPDLNGRRPIFLAGSIEMGVAWNWQETFVKKLEKHLESKSMRYLMNKELIVLNPRRPDWDDSWRQDIREANFFQQVEWELEFLDRAQYKIFYFAKDTLSPITLLELGTFHENAHVCWEDGYKRQGNLQVYCHKKKIKTYKSIDDLIQKIF